MPSKLDQYTVTKTLGKGASAVVKLGTTSDGKRVALKIFDKQNPKNTQKALNALKNEVDSFRLLNHPYMVNLIDFKEHAIWVKPDGNVAVAFMALELIEGGELFDYVALKAFSVPTCRYYFK
jgi:serine/threonine protein kinase